MKMYLPFGDWSNDGHGRCNKVLIEAPSMEHLLNAQKRIKEKYGEDFFHGFAEDYNEPYLSSIVWQALIETEYPIERFIHIEDSNDWDGIKSLQEALNVDECPCVNLAFVEDAFIWLLNAFDAQIVPYSHDYIPTICNWTCHGFETVGYGCFYDL